MKIPHPHTHAHAHALIHKRVIIVDFPRPALVAVLKKGQISKKDLVVPIVVSGDNKQTIVERRRQKLAAISEELNTLFFEYPFVVPDYFALVTRSLLVLEGIALTGDPQFDIFRAA